MNEKSVFIADDHPVVRNGIKAVFSNKSGFVIAGESGDGGEALAKVLTLKPDVAILDVTMPGMNGIEAARNITEKASGTKVIIVSMHTDAYTVIDAFRAGVKGYVLKDSPPEDILKAVETVLAGGKYVSPAVAGELLTGFAEARKSEIKDPVGALSHRELEVMRLVAEGRSCAEIARKLYISVSTVKTHRSNLMKKLKVRDTASIVKIAIRKGMVSP